MEASINVLVDTNIFIKVLRDTGNILNEKLSKIPRVLVSTIVLFEILQGEPNKKRYAATKRYMEQFDCVHLTPSICELGLDLLEKYKFGKGLKYPDALIAGTCLENDCYLRTYNRRDFDFIKGLKLL
jgi:predicted nucleic acid-binding protein